MYDQYNKLAERLVNEAMTFGEFDKLIRINNVNFSKNAGRINDKWPEYFDALMDSKQAVASVKEKIINKLNIYLKLVNLTKITELLVEIKNKNKLTGNFDMLNTMSNSLSATDGASFENKPIRDLDEKTMEIFKQLGELSSDVNFIKCLEKYIANYAFIEWLRAKVLNLNSLKLLAEFASEAENKNEGALEVVKVQSFHLVGMAYSPLIYELPTNSSYSELITCLQQVYRNSLKNPSLADKIVRYLIYFCMLNACEKSELCNMFKCVCVCIGCNRQ